MYLLTIQDICSLVVLHSQPRRDNRYDRQFETQTLQMREMNQELVDVKQTLAYTQKGTHTKALVICAERYTYKSFSHLCFSGHILFTSLC